MRKSWAMAALSSVAFAAAGVAWAADNGAGSPKTEGTGQQTEKMQGDDSGAAKKNGAPVTPQSQGSKGLRLDEKIDRLPAKRGAPNGGAAGSGKDQDASRQDRDATQPGSGNEADTGEADRAPPQNPASPPTTLFPANPKPPADPGKPGNPVTPTSARA